MSGDVDIVQQSLAHCSALIMRAWLLPLMDVKGLKVTFIPFKILFFLYKILIFLSFAPKSTTGTTCY